jgi:CDP-diacylglycerol--glycerol-3-phosphate 3-phosphatidyltransferase
VFDGKIARTLGVASPRGAFVDSTFDRFAETATLIGVTVLFSDSGWLVAAAAAALGGSMLVSYTRARGESLGVTCRSGLMQRQERVLLLGLAALLDPGVSQALRWPARSVFGASVVLLAVGTVGTAAYRTLWISRRLDA